MSYSFVDTIGTPGENTLPAEALSINGQYIENQITGFGVAERLRSCHSPLNHTH